MPIKDNNFPLLPQAGPDNGPAGAPKKHPCPDCRMCQMCAETRCSICRGADRGEAAFAGMSMAEQIEMYERLCAEERAAKAAD